MATIVLKSPGDNIDFGMTWTGLGAATLVSVTHTAPTGLTKVGESTDTVAGTSAVRLSGATHGALYSITGVATLNTGRTLERSFPLRVFAGGG
jgi:hypothetical protein